MSVITDPPSHLPYFGSGELVMFGVFFAIVIAALIWKRIY